MLSKPISPRLSLVVPTYNVAAYLPVFLESVFSQTSQTQRFEVIIVDDGSTDKSGQIARDWAKKHPNHIRYIHQKNQGLSEARNTGLRAARGTWVSFPDPDDFLDLDYFRIILQQTVVAHDNPLLMIVAKLLPYDEAKQTSMDNHPLDYRFRSGLRYIDTSDLGDFIHLSAASCWFDRATLVKHKLRFNPRVKPVFEDGHLVSKLLMLSPERTIAVVPKAVYNYRKRADASSLVMSAKTNKGFYLDTVEYGYLDLILFAKAKLGHVPRFVQRVCLYELQSRIRYLMDDNARIDLLSAEEQRYFTALLEKVMADISVEVIQSFQIGKFNNQHRTGLIGRFKPEEAANRLLYIEKYDPKTRIARFSFFTGDQGDVKTEVICRTKNLPLTDTSSRWTSLVGENFLGQHWFHVRLPKTGEVTCLVNGVEMVLRHIKCNMMVPMTHTSLTAFLRPTIPASLTDDQVDLRAAVLDMPATYQGAWLVMGSQMLAGADAVQLYHHLQQTQKAENLWFVLSVMSPDWARLMTAGVKLLPYGNQAHLAALVQADLLITSTVNPDDAWPVDRAAFADLTQIRRVVLPQETALSSRLADYHFVASKQTAATLTTSEDNSHWFDHELSVTGYPRHDGIIRARISAKTVVIAPDWLRDICADTGDNPLTRHSFTPTEITQYRTFWAAVFSDPALVALQHNHKLTFQVIAGRQMAQNADLNALAKHVTVFEAGLDPNILAKEVAQAELVITDQPNVAFDAAFLGIQALLCRQLEQGLDLPYPDEIWLSQTVEQLVAHITDHYSPCKERAKLSKPKVFYPPDTKECCARAAAALKKLAAPVT